MGRGQQLGMDVCVEVAEGKAYVQSEIRSLQRRLTCVALFVAFFTFTVTYLVCTNSDVFWGNDSFFEPPAALFEKSLTPEDFPNLTNSSGTLGINSSTAGDDEEAKVKHSERGEENLDKSNYPRSLNISANNTSSDLVSGTESGTNVSSPSYFEGAPSPAVSNSSVYNGTLLKESFENSIIEAEVSSPAPEETTTTSAAKNYTSDLRTSKGECDWKQGKWIPDARLPMYNSSTCRYIQEFQNCEKNGRPDVGYLYWKWKPDQCEVPRVNASAFLAAMRNRSVVFAGDSIARNQFQSLLCVLSQVEEPKDTYHSQDDRNHIYLFQSFNVTLRIHWAPYLVRFEDKSTTWPDNTTDTVTYIYVDELDEVWVKAAVGADILQISTGQWWYKRAMYLQKGKPIGCHAWPACFKEIGFAEPYSIAMANILKGSLSIPGFYGTTVYRSFAPDHFEGGEWDTGGTCPRTVPGGVPISYLAEWMYDIQIKQFQNVTEELGMVATNRLKMLDITNIAQIRGDGHPNGYRVRRDKQGDSTPKGSQKDCLHWCLPGPIDAWNDLLMESLRDVIFK